MKDKLCAGKFRDYCGTVKHQDYKRQHMNDLKAQSTLPEEALEEYFKKGNWHYTMQSMEKFTVLM